jgi:hypothetical protein
MAEDGTATFGIEMVDGVSSPAESAATALAKLQDSIKADTKALAEMQKTLNQLKKATNPNTEQIGRLEKAMGQVNARIAKSKQQFIAQGGLFGKNYKGAKDLKGKLDDLAQAASALPGPFGGVLSMLARVAGAKNLAKVAAFALAGAVLALGVAAVASAKHLTDFALAAQEARRNELLMLEASTRLPTVMGMAFGLARNSAKDLQSAVDGVAASVTIGRDEVAKYAAQLDKMGVRGKNIAPALRAVATAASGWGEERATQTAAWAAQLALTGGSVEKLAQRVNNQIGGVVSRKMKSSEVQARKLAESYNSLFGDVDISGLLDARKAFNDLFSQSTNSGKALKMMLGQITQPLINGLTELQRLFKLTVQNIIIALLKAQIAWVKFQIALDAGIAAAKENFPNAVKAIEAVGTVIDELWQLTKDVFGSEWKELLGAAAAVLVVTVAPAIWAAATAMWGFAAGVVAATWPVLATIAGVWLLIKAFEYLYDFMESEDFGALVSDMFMGLINGLWKFGKIFVEGLAKIGSAGIAGFKAIFGMKSPSKVMAELGVNVVQGLEQGVTKESDSAQDAIARAGGDPGAAAARDPAANVPAGAARAAMTSVNIATLSVQVGGKANSEDAKSIAQAVKRELEAILQTVAVQTGASLA